MSIEAKVIEEYTEDNGLDVVVIENEQGQFTLKGKLATYWHEGYYEPGWKLHDYLRNAIDNYGWENFPRWGIKGSKKSNRLMDDLHKIYNDWELVHEYMVMQPLEFTELLKMDGRIPMIGWDDVAAWFDSQLYFENRGLYTNIKRCWTLMRTKLNVFESTLPNKQELPGFVMKDITAEVKNSPRCTYTYDRWAWQKNLFDPAKIVKTPINIAKNKKFDYTDVPLPEFKRYWERRMKLADKATNDLVSYLEEAFDDAPGYSEFVETNIDSEEWRTQVRHLAARLSGSRTKKGKEERFDELINAVATALKQ